MAQPPCHGVRGEWKERGETHTCAARGHGLPFRGRAARSFRSVANYRRQGGEEAYPCEAGTGRHRQRPALSAFSFQGLLPLDAPFQWHGVCGWQTCTCSMDQYHSDSAIKILPRRSRPVQPCSRQPRARDGFGTPLAKCQSGGAVSTAKHCKARLCVRLGKGLTDLRRSGHTHWQPPSGTATGATEENMPCRKDCAAIRHSDFCFPNFETSFNCESRTQPVRQRHVLSEPE